MFDLETMLALILLAVLVDGALLVLTASLLVALIRRIPPPKPGADSPGPADPWTRR